MESVTISVLLRSKIENRFPVSAFGLELTKEMPIRNVVFLLSSSKFLIHSYFRSPIYFWRPILPALEMGCKLKNIYPYRSIGTPCRHQLRRLFPALSAVHCTLYNTAVAVCLYNCQEPTVQLYRQGKLVSIDDDRGRWMQNKK